MRTESSGQASLPTRHFEFSPPPDGQATYASAVLDFEYEVIGRVDAGLRGQDAAVVHAALVEQLHRRLPGIDLDDLDLWAVATAIANGDLVTRRR